MKTGTIVLLNGTSSSGKTRIAEELQQEIDDQLYLYAGIDRFLGMFPKRYFMVPHWYELFTIATEKNGAPENVMKPTGLTCSVISVFHHAVLELAMLGNNVVVDHVLIECKWLKECLELWSGLYVMFVGIRCPLAIAEQRELIRGNRLLGQARAQFGVVHAHTVYDLEVDTSFASPTQCALEIKRRLRDGTRFTAFDHLRSELCSPQ